jgi:hypothetical protein
MDKNKDQRICLICEMLELMTTYELEELLAQIEAMLQQRSDVPINELPTVPEAASAFWSESMRMMIGLRPGDEHADRCPENITRYETVR